MCPCTIPVCLSSVNRGESFRPKFDKIGGLRALANVPFVALTATASDTTYTAIVRSLHTALIANSLNRANIYLSVSPIKSVAVSRDNNMLYLFGHIMKLQPSEYFIL